jgi:DNA-binding MarR family transcriptional regulator
MDAPARSAHRASPPPGAPSGFDDSDLGLGMQLRTAYFAVRRASNALCSRYGSNGDQFILLKLLAEQHGVTQQDLVQRGGYDASTTGNMLKQMEKQGLIRRQPHPDDGRAKLVFLTAKGRTLQEQLWNESRQLRQSLWNALSPKERQVLSQAIAKIVDAC